MENTREIYNKKVITQNCFNYSIHISETRSFKLHLKDRMTKSSNDIQKQFHSTDLCWKSFDLILHENI